MAEHGILCTKCGKRFPPSSMKYHHDTKNMMCVDCVEKIKAELNKSAVSSVPKEKGNKVRYKCMRCNHVFMLKESFNKVCPFCSSANLTTQDWNSDLDKLIKESGQRIYDN